MIINEGRPGKKLPTLTNPGVAGDLLSGKQLIGQDGNIITGTIPSKASTDISVSGRTVTVPAGYYPSQAKKSIASATQATPSITVSSGGLITASATQSAGYVASGTKSATKQLTTQAGKTVTPGTSQQTAVASGRYTTGTVYVAGDSDLKAANIKSGVSIFGVTGTLEAAPNLFAEKPDCDFGTDSVVATLQKNIKKVRSLYCEIATQYSDGYICVIRHISDGTNIIEDAHYEEKKGASGGSALIGEDLLMEMSGNTITIDLSNFTSGFFRHVWDEKDSVYIEILYEWE